MVRVSTLKQNTKTPARSRLTLSPQDRLDFFYKVTNTISSEIDLDRTLPVIIEEVFKTFKPRGASLMVVEGSHVRVVAGRSVTQTPGKPSDLPVFKVGDGVAGRVAVTGNPEWIEDTLDDPRFQKIPGKVSKIRAILAVPLKVKGRVTGVINVTYSEPHHFTDEEIGILQIIAIPAAFAIQNATLFQHIEDEKSKLELIQTSMQGGLTVSKLDGTILFMNDAAHHLYGIRSDVVGISASKIQSNLDRYFNYPLKYDRKNEEVIAEVSAGKTVAVKVGVSSKPPRIIEALYSPLLNKQRVVVGMIGNHRDITELVGQSEQIKTQLISSEAERERWEAIFDNVEEAIVITNKSCEILRSNPAAESLSGLTKKDMLDQEFSSIFNLHNQQGIELSGDLSLGELVTKTREPIEYLEAKLTNAEGRDIWLGLSVSPTLSRQSDRDDMEIIFVMRDVSRLKEIDQAKSDFVSMASHELRTPLTVINGYISLFMSGDLGNIDSPDMVHFRPVFEQIFKSTARLNALVEDLLNVTRIEQGQLSLSLEKMSLDLLVKDVVDEMGAHAKTKNHRLKLESPVTSFLELPPIVKADHPKIKQVMINLIDNAIKYTKPGGEITVQVKKDRKEAIVMVRDTGIGMPKQLLPRIFEKFQRLEGSYVKDSVGTGLGLYIVRELIRAHGGRVWVESQIDKGSTFYFSLPLSRD